MKREVLITRFFGNGNAPTKLPRITSGFAARWGRSASRIVLLALTLTLLMCVPSLSQVGPKRRVENPPPVTRKKSPSRPAPASSRNVRRTSSTAVARPRPSNPPDRGKVAGVGNIRKVFVHEMRVGNLDVPVPERVRLNPGLNPRNKIIEELSKYPAIQIVRSPREADMEIFYDFNSVLIETQSVYRPGHFSNDTPPRWIPEQLIIPRKLQKRFQGRMSVVVPGTNPPEVVWQSTDSTSDPGNPYPAAKMARKLINEMKKVRGER